MSTVSWGDSTDEAGSKIGGKGVTFDALLNNYLPCVQVCDADDASEKRLSTKSFFISAVD